VVAGLKGFTSTRSERTYVFVEDEVGVSHGRVRLGNQTAQRAMAVDKRLKLVVGDDKLLGVAQRLLTCVLTFNHQALEHLYTAAT